MADGIGLEASGEVATSTREADEPEDQCCERDEEE
jgi:hypothetical protein